MSDRRTVQLFSLSDAEYAEFSVLQVTEYAHQLVQAGEVSPEHGLASARERLEDLLADRLRANGHEFHRAASSPTGVTVGWLWISPAPELVGARQAATRWLAQIAVDPAFRGLGWGRAILLQAERSLALRGVEQLWLRVFNWNTIARRLYESLAYELVTQFPTDAHYRKRLTQDAAERPIDRPADSREPTMDTIEHTLRDGRQVLVREARAEDASALLEHLAAVYAESTFLSRGPGEFEGNVPEQEGLIRSYAEAPLKLALSAFVGAELVGSLTFAGKPQLRVRHTGDVGMAVRQAFWGLGIGSALLDFLIDWARATAVITKLNLRVRSDNERAIRLYRRKGFVTEGTVTREHLIDGRYFSQDCMGLEL